ncbi:glutamine synthetase [Phlyctema vagabunda]|uniref:Glutamine synthetase n=1 Tax=Phlyctema vagabunda TaxID=108571 RepID=A0ABR4PX01_9HELO
MMDDLISAIRNTPIIDNHAHPLLIPSAADKYELMAITTEAGGNAMNHTPSTLAHLRAVQQLSEILACPATWNDVLKAIEMEKSKPGDIWAKRCLEGIETILVDDGLDGAHEVFDYKWHDRLTRSACKRIVRIEKVAEEILNARLELSQAPDEVVHRFLEDFNEAITKSISDTEVVGFKSVICYRTGLDIPSQPSRDEFKTALLDTLQVQKSEGIRGFKRLDFLPLNAYLVHETAALIRETHADFKKPLQFHTGLGDNDITLNRSSPAHLQDFIKSYPTVPIILLHSSYPWTQEAGYLACVYDNVYADIGEVFPMISKDGQERIIREILEFCPSEKILWSTDGHWFPETYMLAVIQVREALEKVLTDYVQSKLLTVQQAIRIVEDVLFTTSNKVYNLNLPLRSLEAQHPRKSSQKPKYSDLSLLTEFANDHPKIKYLRLQFSDFTALSRVRIVPIKHALKVLAKGAWSVGITKASLGLLQNDHTVPGVTASGEYKLRPILSSLRPGPSSEYACVQGEFLDESDSPLCPRSLLRRSLEIARVSGLEFLVGFEIEVVFMSWGVDPKYTPLTSTITSHAWSSSAALRDTSVVDMLSDIVSTLSTAGIDVEQFHPESAPGQFEFVLPPLTALEAVDTLLQAREIISTIAANFGLNATLLPKPLPDMPGTASHAHLSISTAQGEDKAMYESFYAGVLKHLRSITAFTYSNPLSYARLLDGCWAGGRWITWGTQNRETPLRKIEGSHWEIKCIDGLANMYFVMAAIISSGTKGVRDHEKMLWKDCQVDPASLEEDTRKSLRIYEMIPGSLEDALAALSGDKELISLLGDDFVARYITVKEAEIKLMGGMNEEEQKEWVIERY